VKYWQSILPVNKEELVWECYEWQVNNLEFGGWAKKLSER
jgi:hypothetical protein